MTTPLTTGDPLPNLALPTLEGEEIQLATFRGERVLIYFWGSW